MPIWAQLLIAVLAALGFLAVGKAIERMDAIAREIVQTRAAARRRRMRSR
jgi:hypothetical protein